MNHHRRNNQVWHVFSRDFTVLPAKVQTHTFIRNRKEPYLPLPSQLWLVLIYPPRRDGRLSRPGCEVWMAVIPTCNLPTATAVTTAWYVDDRYVTSVDSVWRSSGTSVTYWLMRSTLIICFSVSVKNVTTPLRSPVIERTYEMASPTKPIRHSIFSK